MKKLLKGALSLMIAASVGSPQINAATNDYSIEIKSYNYSKHSRSTNPLYGITYTEDDATYTDRNWPLVEMSHAYTQSNYSQTLAKPQIVRQFGVSMGVVYWINPAENYIYWWNTVTGESGRTTPTKSYGVGYADGINNPNFDFTFKGAETGSGAIAQDWYGNLVHMWNTGLNGWGTTAGTHFVQGYAVYKSATKYGELMDFVPKLSKMNDTGRENYPYYRRKINASDGKLTGSSSADLSNFDYISASSKKPNPNYPANTVDWSTNYDYHKANTSIAKQPTDFLGVSGNLWGKGVLQDANAAVAPSAYYNGYSTGQVFHVRGNIAFGNMFADGQYTNWYLNYLLWAKNPVNSWYYPVAGSRWTTFYNSAYPNATSYNFMPGDAANTWKTEATFRETDPLEYFWNIPGSGTVDFRYPQNYNYSLESGEVVRDFTGGYNWFGSVYDLNYSGYLGATDANRVKTDMMAIPEVDSIKGTRVIIHNYWLDNDATSTRRNGSIEIQYSYYTGNLPTATTPKFSGEPTRTYSGIGYAFGYNKTDNSNWKFSNTSVSCWNELERVNNNVFALYTHVPGLGFSKYFITAVKPNNAVSNLKVAQSWNRNGDPVHTLTWTPQVYDRGTMHTYEVWYRKKKGSTYEDSKTIGGTSYQNAWMPAGKASVKYTAGLNASGDTIYTSTYEGCKFEFVAPRGDNGDGTKYERTYEYLVIPVYDASAHRGTEASTSIVTAPAPGKVYGNLYQVTDNEGPNGETRYAFSIRLDPYFLPGAQGSTEAKRLIITSAGGEEGSNKLKDAVSVTLADGTPLTPQEGITFVSKSDGSTTTHPNYAISIDITGKVGADGKLPSIIWHNVDPDLEYKMAAHIESSSTIQYSGTGELSTTLVVPCPTLSLTEVSVHPLLGDYSSIQNDDLLPLGAQRRVGSNEVTNPVSLKNANTLGTKGSAINPLLVTDEVMENWNIQYRYNIFKGGNFMVAYDLDASDKAGGATYYSNRNKVMFDIVGLPVDRTEWDTHTQMGLDEAQKATNENITKYGYNTSTVSYNYSAHVDVIYTRKDDSNIKAQVFGENVASSPIVFSEEVKNGSIFPNLGVEFGSTFVPLIRTSTHWDANAEKSDEDPYGGYLPIYYDAVAQWSWSKFNSTLNHYVGFHAVTTMNCVGHYVTNVDGQMSSVWVPYYAPSVLSDYYVDQTNITLGKAGNVIDGVECLTMSGIGYEGTKDSDWSALAATAKTLPMQVHYVWGGNRVLTNEQSDRESTSTKVLMTADYPIIESTYGATIIHNAVAAINDEDSYYTLIPETNAGETRMNMISSENHSGVVYAAYITTVTGVEGILTDACGGIKIYPNPVGSTFTLQAPMTIGKVKIFTMDGQLVKVVKDVNDSTAKINVEDLPQGMYIVNTLGIAKLMIKQ